MNTIIRAKKFLFGLAKLLIFTNKFRNEKADEVFLASQARNFREIIEKLGPTYTKFGQILSVRYDLFPEFVCKELQYLLDKGKEIPFSYIENSLKEGLEPDAYEKINYLEPEPIGVASLGQVHRAVLRDGTSVAIKVQRPNIRIQLRKDLSLLRFLGKLISFLPFIKDDMAAVVEEFKFWTIRELDYILEATNAKIFSDLYAGDSQVTTPTVYWELTTRTILTTEYVEGVSMKEILAYAKKHPDEETFGIRGFKFERGKLIEFGVNFLYSQLFLHGFIHGDPHPSNIILGHDHKVNVIDFGIVGKMTKSQMALFREILQALVARDYRKLTRLLISLDQIHGVDDPEKLENEVRKVLDKFDVSSVKDVSPTALLLDLSWRANSLDIQFPKYFTLIGKVYSIYDGVIQAIDPFKSLLEHFEPLLEKVAVSEIEDNFDIKKVSAEIYEMLKNYKELVLNSPQKIKELLDDLHSDGIPIRLIQDDREADLSDGAIDGLLNNRGLTFVLLPILLGAVTLLAVYIMVNFSVPLVLIVLLYGFVSLSIVLAFSLR